MFENPRRGRQARNFATTVPKILDLKSSSEQIFSKNCRWVPLFRSNVSANGRYHTVSNSAISPLITNGSKTDSEWHGQTF